MSKYIKIKVNTNLGEIEAGSVIEVLADESGTPLEKYWRRRLKDAEVDNCCELVKPKVKGKKVNSEK